MIYIYDLDCNLIAKGSRKQFENGILDSYYTACGYIISYYKIETVEF